MAPVMSNSVTSQVAQLTEAINTAKKLQVELQQSVVEVQNGMKTMCTVFVIVLVVMLMRVCDSLSF